MRVLVVHGDRRVPLAVPAHVPLVDLLDALGAEVGAGDGTGGGLAVVTSSGRGLQPGASLVEQGVVDGDLLALVDRREVDGLDDPAGRDAATPTSGDVTAAVARLVESGAGARPAPRPGPHPAVPALALTAPAALLPTVPGGGSVALAAAACLLALAGVLGRTGSERALVAAVAACVHAAVAGALLVPATGGWLGLRLAVAGAAAAVVAAVGLALLRERRTLLLPAVAVGVVLAVAALGAGLAAVPVPAALLAAAALGVLAVPALPRLALDASGLARRLPDLGPPPPSSPPSSAPSPSRSPVGGAAGSPGTPEVGSLEAEVRAAHDLVLAGHLTAAAVLLAVTPVAVLAGPAGAALVLAGATVLLTTAGRLRDPGPARPATAAGAAVLLVLVAASLALQPAWRPAVAAGLLAVGLGLLAAPAPSSATAQARLVRVRHRLEGAALLAVLPLLAVASGAVDAVADAVLAASGRAS